MIAFGGEAARQNAIVRQIDDAIARDLFPVRNGRGYLSVVQLLAEGTPDFDFEQYTGMPGALGHLLDTLVVMTMGDPGHCRSLARQWFATPTPGADLTRAARTIALHMIDAIGIELTGTALDLARTVRALHAAESQGLTPAPAQWRGARRSVAQAIAAATDPALATALGIVETLCWPVATSHTILAEAARQRCDRAAEAATLASGWTRQRRAHADAVMNALWQETAAEREANPADYHFPTVFRAHEPDIADGFEAALAISNRAHASMARQIADEALRALPVPLVSAG